MKIDRTIFKIILPKDIAIICAGHVYIFRDFMTLVVIPSQKCFHLMKFGNDDDKKQFRCNHSGN